MLGAEAKGMCGVEVGEGRAERVGRAMGEGEAGFVRGRLKLTRGSGVLEFSDVL